MAMQVFDFNNYHFNVFALPTFTVAIAALLIGVVSLVRERSSHAGIAFFFTTFLFSWWFFCFSWMYCANNGPLALWWARVAYVGLPLFPAAVYRFALVELQVHEEHTLEQWLVLSCSTAFCLINIGSSSLVARVEQYWWGFYPRYGWAGIPFLVFVLATLLLLFFRYRTAFLAAEPGSHRQRIEEFSKVWIVASLAAVDIIPKFGVTLYPFGYLPVFAFILLSARAIWRFRFAEITPALAAQQILDTMNDAVIVVDKSGIIKLVNRVGSQLLDSRESDLIGKPVGEFMQGIFIVDELNQLFGKGFVEREVDYTPKTGSPRILSMSASAIHDRMGKPIAIVCILRDISEKKELNLKVQESQEKYQHIVENSLDGILIIQDGKLVYANPSAAKIFAYGSEEKMKMLDFVSTVAPASRPFVFTEQAGKTLREDILGNYELKGLTQSGKLIDLEMNARIITWNSQPAVQASFRDITDRKMLERDQALWLWEQETLSSIDRKLVSMVGLQKILDAISMNAKSLTRADFAGVVIINDQRTTFTWKSVKGNITPLLDLSVQVDGKRSSVVLSKEPVILKDLSEKTDHHADHFPVLHVEKLLSAACFPFILEGTIKGQLVVGFRNQHPFSGRDLRLLISLAEKSSIAIANAELYENLLLREHELQLLSGARVVAQEEERRRIAREIHDSLGQLLTAIKFNVEILEDLIPKDSPDHQRSEDTKSLLDSAMAEAREISYNLMPSVLVDFGLAPALQLLCEQFSKRRTVKMECHVHGLTERLEPTLEITLYRIVQEALNNIAKHANAPEGSVQVVCHRDGVRVTIEDSGKGFELTALAASSDGRHGMGLVSMRERAASFQGTLTIDSAPNAGTTIVVEIPLKKGMLHENN
jgi:PAS domain S-box-containing protein